MAVTLFWMELEEKKKKISTLHHFCGHYSEGRLMLIGVLNCCRRRRRR